MVCDMKEIQIRKNDAGQRLDRFVGKAVPLLPESLLQKYIRLKRIKRNGKGTKRDVRLVEGDVLQLYINDEFFEKPTEHNAWLKIATPRLDIVYEDENILLADKKPGVLCHSAGEWSWDTLISNIQAYLRQTGQWDPKAENAFTPALCNRIDRNTGGIVIAAKNAEALRILNDKIRDREIEIENFKPEEYWNIDANLKPRQSGCAFNARLTAQADGTKLVVKNKKQADAILAALDGKPYTVTRVDKGQRRRQQQIHCRSGGGRQQLAAVGQAVEIRHI